MDFMSAWEGGKHVYMGEHSLKILLIPHKKVSGKPVTIDSEILYTDISKLSSDEVKRVRLSK